MSSARGPGGRRGARRNGITGASRPDGRRSAQGRSRGSGGSAIVADRGRGPGDKRRTRGPGPTRATAAPHPVQRWTERLTGRAILLAAVVVLLVVSLAYPLQRYLAQQATIDGLEAENSAAQERVEDLRVRVDQLDDPAFIQTQAQSRLQYVMPGDLLYVIDDSGRAQAVPGQDEPAPEDGEVAWFERVVDSIQIADAGG
ncbi:hypothetical protein BH24ACT9_BH24ACT9_11080 [soil metagenome]